MPAVVEARSMICAVPREHFDTRTTWLHRVGKVLRIEPTLARKIYYGQRKRIDADTFLRMREAMQALESSAMKRRGMLNDLADVLAAAAPVARGETGRDGLAGAEEVRQGTQAGRASSIAAVRQGK